MLLANSLGLITCFTLSLYHVICMSSIEKDNNADWGNSSTCLCHQFCQTDNWEKIPVMPYEDQINYIPVHSVSMVILIVQKLDWKRIVVLSDDKWDTYVDDLVEKLYEMGVRLVRYTMDTSHAVHGTPQILTILKERYDHNILLLAQTDRIRSLFELVNTWESICFSQNIHWLVVSQDEMFPISYCTHHVLAVQPYSVIKNHSCHFPLHIDSPWGIRLKTAKVSRHNRHFANVQEWHTEGSFPSSMNEIVPAEKLYPNGEIGLDNKILQVAVVPWPSYIIKHYVDNETTYSGIAIDCLKELSRFLNFRYEFREPPDGEFGRIVNQTWTGTVGMLLRKEVDLVVAPLTYESTRKEVIDFILPLFYETFLVYFRPLNDSEATWTLLSNTFTWPTVSVTIFLLITLALCAAVETLQQRQLRPTVHAESRFGGWLMNLAGILLRQGDVDMPRMRVSNLLWAIWSYGSLILAASVGANLMSSLAVPHTNLPFSTLEELAANEEYTLGHPSGGFTELLLKTSGREIYQRLWDKIQRSSDQNGESASQEWKHSKRTLQDYTTYNFNVHFTKLQRGKHAFISNHFSMLGRCNVNHIPESLSVVPAGFAVLKGSPYTDKFSRATMLFHDLGLIDQMHKAQLRHMPPCVKTMKGVRELDMSDLKAVFYILFCMLVISLVTLILEIFFFHISPVRK